MAQKQPAIKDPVITSLEGMVAAYTLIAIKNDLEKYKVKDINKKKQAIFRSTIINLCASWETFFAVALEISVEFLKDNVKTSDKIPSNILLRISEKLIKSEDKRLIWKISDDGWKEELQINYLSLKEKFNTARATQIDEFVYQTIGLKNLSSNWKWKNHSVDSCKKRLDSFMTLRGNITHRIFTEKTLNKTIIIGYTNFLYRLILISANVIRKYIHDSTNKYPWIYEKPKKIVN